MAKKIRLDFSKVEERSGWNTKEMPEGLHRFKVVGVEETEAQDGTDMLVYALVPTNPRYKTRRFPFYCKLQQNQLWKLRDLIVAAGGTVPKKATMIDPNSPVGKEIAAEVEDESGQYAGRSSINGVYGLDILDDEDGAEEASDEDDEEYEGDEDADEYDDEDEAEEEEDEEEEDLETLTLAELRKLAKSLGIDTAGLKKADLIESIEEEQAEESEDEDDDLDEDDLDDEDLGDDDFEDDEDEEEEEAPAPKRRPAATRKAAPAKAAPKRVVKRSR